MTDLMDENDVRQLIEQTKEDRTDQLYGLKQHEIKKLQKTLSDIRNQKYKTSRGEPKYGNLDRTFKLDELPDFFREAPNFGIKTALLVQFFYALRIGELQHLEYEERRDLLKVYQPKNDRTEWIPVHGKTDQLLKYTDEIRDYSTNYLRRRFSEMRDESGYDYVYGQSSDGRDLYRINTHSLRKTAITLFSRNVDHSLKIKEFARHRDSDTTMRYFEYDFNVWKEDLEKTFDDLYALI